MDLLTKAFLIISGIVIYTVSACGSYIWIQKVYYHEKGLEYGNDPKNEDIIFTFCPVINTLFFIVSWFHPWKDKEYRTDKTNLPRRIFKP